MSNRNIQKIALVTGGSRGIGRSISISLSKAGVFVALTYKTNKALADEVAKYITANGGTAISLHMQIEDRRSVREALQILKMNFGQVNILINNAAVAQEKPFETITDKDWDHLMSVNLKGPFICCQEVVPEMVKEGWGRIINITSVGGQWGGTNQVHYAASKAALISLTRSLARLYSKNGITSNAVSPGLVDTDMIANEIKTAAGQEKLRNIPIGRIATAEEIAQVVVFLASDDAAYITGQTINVNGGMYFG